MDYNDAMVVYSQENDRNLAVNGEGLNEKVRHLGLVGPNYPCSRNSPMMLLLIIHHLIDIKVSALPWLRCLCHKKPHPLSTVLHLQNIRVQLFLKHLGQIKPVLYFLSRFHSEDVQVSLLFV